MGTFKSDDNSDAQHSETTFAPDSKPAITGTARLPFILREAMVNHKKPVHPPCMA